VSDDPTEPLPEPPAPTPAGSDAPTVASPTVDTPADSHAAAAAPRRRTVSAPAWAILLGVIVLIAGGAAAALALNGGSSDHTGPAAAPVTTTSTSSVASDFPDGAAPGGTAAGTSGGGSASGGTPAGKSSTQTPKPTVVPHLGQLDFGTCAGGAVFYADVSWITKNATALSITKSGQIFSPGNVKKTPSGSFHLGISCVPDHDLVFTATGPGGTARETVTLKYVVGNAHIINFSAPATTDCQGGTNASVPFAYGTVNATSVKLSVSASPLPRTSGTTSFGFTCPQMYLGTETYQVTLTATNPLGSDTRTVAVSLHPTS
jgi:hypothetical protein